MNRPVPLLVVLLALAPLAAATDPDPALHWFAEMIPSLAPPVEEVVVLVAVPGYAPDDDPASGPALAMAAVAEATGYWSWALAQSASAYPQLAGFTLVPRLEGVDATAADAARARIVVNVADAEPSPLGFQLAVAVADPLATDVGATACTVTISALGRAFGGVDGLHVRNLALHEIGHCLGLGHTGVSGTGMCNANGTCYDGHPTDLMSVLDVDERQCVSNLNAQALGEAYAWRAPPAGAWAPNDGETYMLKADYAQACMPDALRRF